MKFLFRLFDFFFARLDLEKKTALTAITWGGWGMINHTFDSSPAYRYLVATGSWFPLGPEVFWGGLISLAGALQVYGLISERRVFRMIAAIFACTLWLSLGLAFLLHNPRGFSLVIYGLLAWANAALYYQVGTARRA